MSTNSLISLGGNLETPRNASGKDFPAVGPTGAAGEASGAGQLVKQTETQMGPMHTQDSGDQTPSVWGKADFPVTKNKGEGIGGSSPAWSAGIDCNTGQMSPNAASGKYTS